MKHILFALAVVATIALGAGCDSLPSIISDPKAQITLDTTVTWNDKQAPSTEVTTYDLMTDQSNAGKFYRDNKEKLKEAKITYFVFNLDSIVFDPARDPQLAGNIDRIKNLRIANLKFDVQVQTSGGEWSTVETVWQGTNVLISDHWKIPTQVKLSEELSNRLSASLIDRPVFRVIQTYGEPSEGSKFYKLIRGRFMVTVDLTLNL